MNFIIKAIFPNLKWTVKCWQRRVYLTFDDGPTPEVTPLILDILDKYDAKATFFCIGENVEANPSLYEDIVRRGHATGVHGYEHINGWTTKNKNYIDNIHKANQRIMSGLFRPPYGRITMKQADALKNDFDIIMWSHMSHDYNQGYTPQKCFKNATKNLSKGSIVVFHDSLKAQKNVLATLPMFLEHIDKHKYKTAIL